MFILRVLKNAYELFDATDVVRLAKSSVRNVAALGLATRMIDADGDTVLDSPVFVGSGFAPSSPGTDGLVYLKPGVAFLYDSAQADVWLGEVKVAFSDAIDTVALATNVDGSGDDRIDVVSLRLLEVEEDEQLRYFKDPTSLSTYQANSPQRVRLDYEIVVTTGVVAAVPAAPATPAGTFKVAEVLRVNGQANVNPDDVTDSRNLDRVRGGFVEAFTGISTRAGGIFFGDPGGDYLKIERDSDSAPTTLRVRNQAGSGMGFEAGKLLATSRVISNEFRARLNTGTDGIFDFFDDDASAYGVLVAKNVSLAWGSFLYTGGTWVLQEGYNLGGTVTKASTGNYNVQFGVDILNNAGAALATFSNAGTPLHVEAGIVDFAGVDRLQIRTYNLAGAITDPLTGDRVHVSCFTLPTP